MRVIAITLSALALAGCAAQGGNPPFVGTQYPPGAASAMSEPQPLTSLPPGAANFSSAPNATEPNFASVTLRAF